MADKLLFYYFGDDEAYYRTLQGEFRTHAKVAIEFQRFFEATESKIQSLFLNVFNDKPTAVFIDFSKHSNDYLHLARLLTRTPLEIPVLLVGLVDYLSPPEILTESILTGCNLNFIKSAETFDVAFEVTKLLRPEAIGEHGFAQIALKEQVESGTLCKAGFINPEGLHIETDQKISKGDRLALNHFWLEKRIVPSKNVFVKNVGNKDLFYQFKQNADLDFLFEDDLVAIEGMEADAITERINDRNESIRYHKKMLKKWIEDHKSDTGGKRTKLLVVDRKFHFYKDQPRTDKHTYTIRCVPSFTDIAEELDRLKPQIIAFEIDKEDDAKNTLEVLGQLSNIQNSMFSDNMAFIIVFNSPLKSEELQARFHSTNIMGHDEELSPGLLLKMADVLQKRTMAKGTVTLDESQKMFLKKNHPSSVVEILREVTIVKISETDMLLQSDYPYAAGTNLHLKVPVEMFVNIRPVLKPTGKVPEFYGLIHSIGEKEKQILRQYVNAVFFRDHDAQVSAEAEEFKKLNELKFQEKIDEIIKLHELEAKKKLEKEAEAEKKNTKKVEEPEKTEDN